MAARPLPADSPLAPLLSDAKALVVAFTAADGPASKLERLEKDLMPRRGAAKDAVAHGRVGRLSR